MPDREQLIDALVRVQDGAFWKGCCVFCNSCKHPDGSISHDEDCPLPYVDRALAEKADV